MAQVKFVVLTSSRTGSTWLIDILNMQSGVEAHGELFLNQRRTTPAIAGRDDRPRYVDVHGSRGLSRAPRVVCYLNELYRSPHVVGFKLMYSQLRVHPEILAYLALRRVRIVHLVRLNHLDVIISEELAKNTGASHVRAGTNANLSPVNLDTRTLVRRIRRVSRAPGKARFLIRLSACPILEVSYEALLGGQEEFTRVCDFLQISCASALRSNLQKRGTGSHRDAIANYEEVRQTLSSTPFASLLR
jgi:LPS sulfotransferase NodH